MHQRMSTSLNKEIDITRFTSKRAADKYSGGQPRQAVRQEDSMRRLLPF